MSAPVPLALGGLRETGGGMDTDEFRAGNSIPFSMYVANIK